jgi:hypothetical protein
MVEGLILFSIGFVGLSLVGVKRYKEAKRKRLQETLDKWIDVIIDLYEKEKDE